VSERDESAPPAGWRPWVRRLAPYLVATAAIVAVLRRYPPAAIAREMQRGEWLAMAPFMILLLTVGLSMVVVSDWMVMRACTGGPPFLVAFRGKTGAAVLNVVGYSVQAGGYGVWIARATGTGAGLTGGIVLYILASELTALALIAAASVWFFGAEVPAALRWGAPGVAALMLGFKVLGALGLVREGALPSVFRPWRLVRPRRALGQVAIRTAHLYLALLCAWGAANAFGLAVPFVAMSAYFPVILLVGSLPVNVAGFGAVQGAWLLLLPWAPGGGEQILAFSVLWQLMLAAGVVARGLPFVRRVVAEIDEGRARANAQAQRTQI
jgi:hypothetical protein